MAFEIRLGIPEMEAIWQKLTDNVRSGLANPREETLYRKLGKAFAQLAADPKYPGLKSHEIVPLSERYGQKVWQSYLENRKGSAMRIFWVYGPGRNQITVIGMEPHPESSKNGGYDHITLSEPG